MEYKIPKVLEKEPEVQGFSMIKVAIIVICSLGFLFTCFNAFLQSLVFPVFAGIYFTIKVKFPGKGELEQFVKYSTGHHCIKHDIPLRNIIRTSSALVEEEDEIK